MNTFSVQNMDKFGYGWELCGKKAEGFDSVEAVLQYYRDHGEGCQAFLCDETAPTNLDCEVLTDWSHDGHVIIGFYRESCGVVYKMVKQEG